MKLVWAFVLTLSLLCRPTFGDGCPLYEDFTHSRCFTGQDIGRVLANTRVPWVVEFYSSWCGHCRHFAPTWMEIATRVKKWSSVVKMGQIDCSQSDNREGCGQYDIAAYPSIMFFNPNPSSSDKPMKFTGGRSHDVIIKAIIDHIVAQSVHQSLLQPLAAETLEGIKYNTVLVLVFEDSNSYIGKEMILDYQSKHDWTVYRVLQSNTRLVQQYSILEFPSLVLQSPSGNHAVIPSPGVDIVQYFETKANEFVGIQASKGDDRVVMKGEGERRPVVTATASPVTQGTITHGTITQGTITQGTITTNNTLQPSIADISSAISYALRSEVSIQHIISDNAFLSLYKFILQIEKAFLLSDTGISTSLRLLRIKLESKNLGGFIFTSEWQRTLQSKLKDDVFPREPQWKSCQGSKSHLRGFPCGLWVLMHTITILSLPSSHNTHPLISSRAALEASVGFVKNFFSCEECRTHFTKMAEGLKKRPISYEGDAILWLWEAHNIVNERLKDDLSSDPQYPKTLFPPYKLCPYCYNRRTRPLADSLPVLGNIGFRSGESLLPEYHDADNVQFTWNRTAVLLFLVNFYGMGHFNDISQQSIVKAAWPYQQLALPQDYSDKPPHNLYCIQLVLCVGALVLCAFYVLRRYFIRSHRFKYM